MEIRYRLDSMEETGFTYKPDFDYDKLDFNSIAYQFSHHLSVDQQKEEVSLWMTVAVKPEGSGTVLAREAIYVTFRVEPFSEVIHINSNGSFTTTAPQLMDTFFSVAIGALRGMLVKNLKGTPLAGSVMPFIPIDMIRQNTTKQEGDE